VGILLWLEYEMSPTGSCWSLAADAILGDSGNLRR
jgi:hypothetical protein